MPKTAGSSFAVLVSSNTTVPFWGGGGPPPEKPEIDEPQPRSSAAGAMAKSNPSSPLRTPFGTLNAGAAVFIRNPPAAMNGRKIGRQLGARVTQELLHCHDIVDRVLKVEETGCCARGWVIVRGDGSIVAYRLITKGIPAQLLTADRV